MQQKTIYIRCNKLHGYCTIRLMKEEQLKSILKLKFLSGRINISTLSKELLLKLEVADEDQNKIDMSRLKLGSLGAYIIFENDTQDQITVNSSSMEIESFSQKRISDILEAFKLIFDQIEILSGEYLTNFHFIEKGLPEKLLDRYSIEDSYSTEIVQLKKGKDMIQLYQCAPNTLHVRQSIQLKNKVVLNELVLDSAFDLTNQEKHFNNFIDKKIKL